MLTANMAEKSDGSDKNSEIFTISEFTECFDLPKWVEVVGGKDVGPTDNGSCNIKKGMILILRTLAVDKVTLSFTDSDTGVKRIVQVSPDTQVKFKVLLPNPDFKAPQKPRTVYERVSDLLTVCPTYFKANVFYDDPYLPAIVKSGEVFRFIRQIKHESDRRTYLQCEDADGNIIELPCECRGDFTAVEDDKSYSLKEVLELGPVDRKLILSRDHIKMDLVEEAGNEENLYCNLSHSDGTDVLQRIMGLPLSYSGLLTYHKPKMFLAASPSDNLQEVWKIPLSVDIQVKEFTEDQYERPTIACTESSSQTPAFKLYKLSELLDTYHEDFPVLATLVHYKDMPVDFKHCLEPGCDVIIHDIERFDRILAKSGEMQFSIARNMEGRFRKTLKKFESLEDLKAAHPNPLSDHLYVKVLQEIASDFPVAFSLQTGDVLRFKSLQTKLLKMKSKKFGPFQVINCEKSKESGSFEKIQLPVDLEVCLHEMPSRTKAEGFTAEEVFRYKPELPLNVDFLADDKSLWSCLPISSEISLTNFVTEAIAIISPVPKYDHTEDSRKYIDNRIRDCLLVPTRHHMMLTVKDCLGFPPGYFMFPDKSVFIHCPVEKISKQSYEELIRHNDMAYEDYEPESPVSAGSGILLPSRSKSKDSKESETVNKRLSKSLTNMFKNKPNILNKLKGRKSSADTSGKPVTLAVQNDTYQAGSMHSSESFEEDNIYESVNVKGKHSKS
ncbi:uncharacterized protein LOC132756259 [Ruditapes philippinarum]|uniref:uncharacterized protein LOC132756259 n=1 Tax=Ruditapes philippinarum TaxID=129788 RepID=UPI00295B8EEA|nr:uncharacterized protein LOC132756259 [Ruditapes philippinarum]